MKLGEFLSGWEDWRDWELLHLTWEQTAAPEKRRLRTLRCEESQALAAEFPPTKPPTKG